MAIETERKFLVKNGEFKNVATRVTKITQGYLSKDPNRTVRVRIKGEKAFITIKGPSSENGMSRFEWEQAIDKTDAVQLFDLCLPGIIDKIRYDIPFGQHTIEVDEFFGSNLGLVLAEIELSDETENIDLPDWIGEEVTGNPKYYNSQLSSNE